MNMPKLPLHFSFSLTLSTCLLGAMPLVVYAGGTDVTGGGASGADNFIGTTGNETKLIYTLSDNTQELELSDEDTGKILGVSPKVQSQVTRTVAAIESSDATLALTVDGQPTNVPTRTINQITTAMRDDANSAAVLEKTITSQVTQNQDISPEAIASITSNISTLITAARTIFNLTITPITESDAEADLIPVKNLEIDPNQLNDAILAYNKVILEADEEGLIALSNSPEFLAIGEIMRQFRAAFSTSAAGKDGEDG